MTTDTLTEEYRGRVLSVETKLGPFTPANDGIYAFHAVGSIDGVGPYIRHAYKIDTLGDDMLAELKGHVDWVDHRRTVLSDELWEAVIAAAPDCSPDELLAAIEVMLSA